jgi:hypothetical protein
MRNLLLLTMVALAACAPAQSPRLNRADLIKTDVILEFKPDKGEGKAYKLGEQVRFTFQTTQAGFVTMLSYGPTGNTEPLERNLQLKSGKHIFPRAEDRQGNAQAAYVVGAPTGNNRVILIYTNTELKTIPRGRLDPAQLEAAVKTALQSSNATAIDVAETAIEVTP